MACTNEAELGCSSPLHRCVRATPHIALRGLNQGYRASQGHCTLFLSRSVARVHALAYERVRSSLSRLLSHRVLHISTCVDRPLCSPTHGALALLLDESVFMLLFWYWYHEAAPAEPIFAPHRARVFTGSDRDSLRAPGEASYRASVLDGGRSRAAVLGRLSTALG